MVTVVVEDLLGPLNEMERKHAPERLWIGGDASIFEMGTLVSVVGSRSASRDGDVLAGSFGYWSIAASSS